MITQQQDYHNSPLSLTLSRKGRGNISPLAGEMVRSTKEGVSGFISRTETLRDDGCGETLRSAHRAGYSAGFTLIELLVVVLIIGILAAVALPQYQKAVRKARIAEAKVLLKAIGDAGEVYCLSHDCVWFTPSIDDFDISIPTETKNWEIILDDCSNGGFWYVATPTFETGYGIGYVDKNYDEGGDTDYNGRFICDAYDEQGHKICSSLGTNFDDTYYHID